MSGRVLDISSPQDVPRIYNLGQSIYITTDQLNNTIYSTLPIVAPQQWTFVEWPHGPNGYPEEDLDLANKKYTDYLYGLATALPTSLYVTEDRSLNTNHKFVQTDGSLTLTLYAATGNEGRQIIIQQWGAGTVVIEPQAGENINGEANITIDQQYNSLTLISDGYGWNII